MKRLSTVPRIFSRSSKLARNASTAPPILAEINSDLLIVEKTTTPKPKLPREKLVFGQSFSDHLLEIDWSNDHGWHAPKIRPYGDFTVSPAASVFHYGMGAFEGMKAYRCSKDSNQIRLFRPEKNMDRMNKSAEHLFFPTFDGEELLDCLRELVRIDSSWVPEGDGYSLYIRPTMISTHAFVGVAPAANVKLYVILSPVGPYYATGFNAVTLLADPKFVRAWPGGSGHTKIGGNYAPTISVQRKAAEQGFSQVLWLFGEDEEVTEVGTMNQFFF